MKKTAALLSIVLGLAAAVGCSDDEPAPAAPAQAAATPVAAEPAAAAPGQSAVCEKAVNCCIAYVQAMANTPQGAAVAAQGEAACQAVRQAGQVGPAGEPACQQMVASWRATLTQMHVAVPATCAE